MNANASPRIGDPVNRFDGEAKVTGSARYAAEHFPPGLLYGWIVSSPIARGRVTGIDDAAARRVPGMVEVISHRNRRHLPWFDRSYEDEAAPSGSPFRPLFDDKVRFSGQPVALVVAQTLEAARDAASLVRVRYESASHNTDFERAMAERFEPKSPRNVALGPRSRGDPAKAVTQSQVGGKYVSPEVMERFAGMIGGATMRGHDELSDRELEVLKHLAAGESLVRIAELLHLSPSTVTTYRARVLEKMGMKSNAELTRYALEHGLLG